MEAEGTCMILARKLTISCHFRMISEGTSIKCATRERSMFLGSDGEGSITAPVAVCDSSHGRPNRRCGQTSNVCSGVIRVGLTGPRRLPVYPGERTFSGSEGMFQRCPGTDVHVMVRLADSTVDPCFNP
jgi:hypothetical protein